MSKEAPSAETIGKGVPVSDSEPAKVPGRTTRPDPKVKTGDPYIDHGSVCDGAPESATCFFEDRQRAELIDRLQLDIANAALNAKLALTVKRVDTLLKKIDNDPGIIGGIAIDLAKDFAVDKLADVLGHLQKQGMGALDSGPGGAIGPPRMNKKQEVFAKLTDARIKGALKRVADPVKKAFSASVGQSDEVDEKKAATLTLIKQLTQNVNRFFQEISKTLPAVANDAELAWLHLSFRNHDAHSQAAYEDAWDDKIERFQKSGIDKIGRRHEGDRSMFEGISRLTRVCAIHYTSGHPPEHWLEIWDQDRSKIRITEELLAEERGQIDGIEFRQVIPDTPGPGLLKRIPDEFVEIALQRQEQVYADRSMGIRVIDESDYSDKRYGEARYKKAHLKTKGPLPSTGDPLGFAPTPANALEPAPSLPMSQPTSFGDPDREPIIPPTGPLGFGGGST